MTPAEFKAAIGELGWNHRQLARLLACDHNLPARWAAGSAPVPPTIASWLDRLVIAHANNPVPTDWRSK